MNMFVPGSVMNSLKLRSKHFPNALFEKFLNPCTMFVRKNTVLFRIHPLLCAGNDATLCNSH